MPARPPTESTLTREETANLEAGHTFVRPSTARALVSAFLALIALPAAIEVLSALRGGEVASSWSAAARLPAEAVSAWRTSTFLAANRVVLKGIREFEDALDDEARAPTAVRPFVQAIASDWLKAGSERVVQGRDEWLFYRPDVEHIVGRGFLEPAELKRRREQAGSGLDPLSPDPRPALVDFKRQLSERGIALLVVPTPVKPSMQPRELGLVAAARGPRDQESGSRGGVLVNNSFDAFIGDLREAGVEVFDLTDALADRPGALADRPQYLATDTHWRPETMERAADRLAAFIRSRLDLPPATPARLRVKEERVLNMGDTAAMLDLPAGHRLTRPEPVIIHRLVGEDDGGPWRPERGADVLVLGDSFSNIYSLESMGWGGSAGFIEHLGRALARPLDRIVQNDAGAYATRDLLRQELARGSDRLTGKRLVVLQFSARELSIGDWKVIALP